MTIDEERFTMALRDLAGQDPLTAAPTEQVLGRAHRARRTRAVTVATASLGVVALAAVAVVGLGGNAGGTGGTPGSGSTGGVTAAADTPATRLVAAVQASAKTSFRFTMTTDEKSVEFGQPKPVRERRFAGAYDPRVPKGYVRYGQVEQGILGNEIYKKGADGSGIRLPATGRGLDIGQSDIGLLNPLATVDFVKQFAALKDAGKVTLLGTSGSGASAVERYSFQYVWNTGGGDHPDTVPVSGIIEVGVQSRLVTTMSYDYSEDYPNGPAKAKFDYKVRWEYSDYGTEVNVQLPPKRYSPPVK